MWKKKSGLGFEIDLVEDIIAVFFVQVRSNPFSEQSNYAMFSYGTKIGTALRFYVRPEKSVRP